MKEPCLSRLFDLMRTNTLGFTALILLASLSTSFTIGAQQTPPPRPAAEQPPITFKVEVNYVEIDAIVTDEQGNFVRNLTKDDFQVTEQGKPQTVSVASLVDIPVEKFDPPLFKTKPIEPDVRSNRKEFDGRVFVIVLDDLNTSFSRSARVKLAARQFIERYLGANDVAAIVQTGGAKSTGAGVHRQPRAPAARREQLHGPEGTVGHARADRRILPDARHRHHRAAARPERGDSRLQGAEHVHGPQERRGLHGRYPRPSQGRRLLQRRDRLRHLRSDQQHRTRPT